MRIRGYGEKRKIPPQPLFFDRVNEGRPVQSNSLLFQLPFEILGQILQHVEPASLPSLALVNRDCRQLARSRQFSSIKLYDGKQADLDLIELLRAEDRERDANGTTLSPSLGVCIRRIKVIEGSALFHRQINPNDGSFLRLDSEGKQRKLQKACDFYHEVFFPRVQDILSNRRVLPHLDELVCKCRNAVPQSFFNSLIQSSLQHLKLYDVPIGADFTINLPDTLAKSWPLRTLHLELQTDFFTTEVTTASLCASLLGLCSQTLESLTWIDRCCKGEHSFATAGLNSAPCFTRLRRLFLDHRAVLDLSVVDALIHDKIRTLSVRNDDSVNAKFFYNRGSIPSLRKFDLWAYTEEYTGPILRFLMANSHLSMLSLQGLFNFPADFCETRILPLLSSSFSELTSLSLSWNVLSISESTLGVIGSLKPLQQIHLSGGYHSDWRPTFQINHKAMQNHLQKLGFLKKIAISRDTYPDGSERSSLGYYYQDKFLADRDPEDPKERKRIWEQKHRELMLAEANEYVHVMPQLEWLYFGQIQIGFRELSSNQERIAVALHFKREMHCAVLKSMFGVPQKH